MYIVTVTSECAPVARVGALADVVFGLNRELERRGHAVEIILPKYDSLRHEHVQDLQLAWRGLQVPWGEGSVACTVFHGVVQGRSCFFI